MGKKPDKILAIVLGSWYYISVGCTEDRVGEKLWLFAAGGSRTSLEKTTIPARRTIIPRFRSTNGSDRAANETFFSIN